MMNVAGRVTMSVAMMGGVKVVAKATANVRCCAVKGTVRAMTMVTAEIMAKMKTGMTNIAESVLPVLMLLLVGNLGDSDVGGCGVGDSDLWTCAGRDDGGDGGQEVFIIAKAGATSIVRIVPVDAHSDDGD